MLIAIRARLTAEGQIELVDPLPPEVYAGQDVLILVDEKVYLNEFGIVMVVDEDGTEYPLHAFTHEERMALLAEMDPLDIDDPVSYVKKLRGTLTDDEAHQTSD